MKIFIKILKLIGIIFLFILPTLRVWINYESSFYAYLYYFLALVLFIILVIKIFKNIKNKKINISILILLCLIILDMLYYENFSMKIEPLIHMHNKYNIPYSEMKVIETTKSNNPIVGSYQPREALIKTENTYITFYYRNKYILEENGWQDDYPLSKLIAETLSEFTHDYKYFKNYYDDNHYSILMKKNDSYTMSAVIKKLDIIAEYVENFGYDVTFVDNYKAETILNPTYNTSLIEHIASVNYKNIDSYYDKNDFLSKKFLTDIQRKKIEETDFDGFEFVYYYGSDYIDIRGYTYKK